MVGIGAIIFNDLYNQRIKDVTFSWDKIHSFDGETGPYVQYTYARAASVLRKTGITDVPEEIDSSLLTDEAEIALIKSYYLIQMKLQQQLKIKHHIVLQHMYMI